MPISATPLEGHIAFVTGSSRGIGRAIAIELAAWGADVAVHARRNIALAEAVAGEIRSMGRRSVVCTGDVKEKSAMEACADQVKSELGAADILVNNAGTRKDGHFILMNRASIDEVMDVNFFGAINTVQAFVREMMSKKWGRIINLVSPSAILGSSGQANYAASKGALISLTRTLARELAPFGVLVNAINPGLVKTELTADVSDELAKEILTPSCLRRVGFPEEIAPAVAFLASGWASYISGQTINVDGGLCT